MPTAMPTHPAEDDTKARSSSRAQTGESVPSDGPRPAHQRRTLFSVPFKSRMTDVDLARLHSSLDLATYVSPKPGVSGASPGVAPLDFWSGLFLEAGAGKDEWVLQGRTWGNPPEAAIHEWHLLAALAASALDSTVQVPRRAAALIDRSPIVPLSGAANKRLARLGRRLLGIE